MSRKCRFCKTSLSQIFVDLGKTPLANSFLDKKSLYKTEPFYPLCAFVCEKCFLVQLEEYEAPDNIFGDYAYFSSYSESWLKHAKDYVEMITERFRIDENSQIIEIASNDGYLLQFFKEKNIPILGIEPAKNIAKFANQKNIPTLEMFFNVDTAKKLLKEGKQADLLIGNNVLAHVTDLNDFVEGLKILLKSKGIITMEFPHLLQIIKQNQFDTIYHEHLSYFSLLTVQKIFLAHSLTIFDVEELKTHGGSLRIYVKHNNYDAIQINKSVKVVINNEKKFGLDNISQYTNFLKKVNTVKQNLLEFCKSAKNEGKKVVCYGASAKGNTLLNYCGIGSEYIEYVVDRSPHKQKLFLPGTHLEIKNPEKIRETKPDYLLITPWNLKDEIMEQMNYIAEWGGKFVIPIPEVKIFP